MKLATVIGAFHLLTCRMDFKSSILMSLFSAMLYRGGSLPSGSRVVLVAPSSRNWMSNGYADYPILLTGELNLWLSSTGLDPRIPSAWKHRKRRSLSSTVLRITPCDSLKQPWRDVAEKRTRKITVKPKAYSPWILLAFKRSLRMALIYHTNHQTSGRRTADVVFRNPFRPMTRVLGIYRPILNDFHRSFVSFCVSSWPHLHYCTL